MIDLDNSFIRLRDNFDDARDMSESPLAHILYYDQIRLAVGEAYTQISNSPTPIIFNSNYEVYLIDDCGIDIQDVTDYIFIEEFFDTNGIKQVKWEFINNFDYHTKELAFRFTNTVNGDTWYTNLFLCTDYEKEFTSRFDYKGKDIHEGTHYERADVMCSIRLKTYYRNKINESERGEYHQISTTNTVSERNIKKQKDRYLVDTVNEWVNMRIESMITSKEVYVDCIRAYSTTPIDFEEPELDSNMYQGEMILNRDFYDTYDFEYQIFQGFFLSNFNPSGNYASGYIIDAMSTDANIPITLNTGTATVYDSSNTLIATFTELDMVIQNDNQLKIVTTGSAVENLPNGTYHVNISEGLVSGLGIPNTAINDSTTWVFVIRNSDYSSIDYNSNDYFTD